ncbi:MAG: hypothetical protein BWZ10_00484 [candidate division BRC1 bacterium ADurb.BinA364]|nr:MAG: hypothetical protein BWZ10_00484 [candidate division BRC1 bacterium ADurb.BinA364]
MQTNGGERGFYMIALLIVIAVLLILSWGYFDPSQGVSTYQSSMNSAKTAECAANRNALLANIAVWRMSHPNRTPSIEALRNSNPPVAIPVCREGGIISIGPQGEIFCSVHYPAPTPTPTPLAVDFLAGLDEEPAPPTPPGQR